MKIAVVILNWNGEALLERFLPSVVAYSEGTDVYLVDNASTDGSVDFLREHYPTIKIVQNSTNGGFAKGYNEGLKHIEADVYCLLIPTLKLRPIGWNPSKTLLIPNQKQQLSNPKYWI